MPHPVLLLPLTVDLGAETRVSRVVLGCDRAPPLEGTETDPCDALSNEHAADQLSRTSMRMLGTWSRKPGRDRCDSERDEFTDLSSAPEETTNLIRPLKVCATLSRINAPLVHKMRALGDRFAD